MYQGFIVLTKQGFIVLNYEYNYLPPLGLNQQSRNCKSVALHTDPSGLYGILQIKLLVILERFER